MESDTQQNRGGDASQDQNQKGSQDLNVAFALGEVHGQLNVFMKAQEANFQGLRQDLQATSSASDAKTSGLEARLAYLEKWHYKISGAAALVGTVIGWGLQYLRYHV